MRRFLSRIALALALLLAVAWPADRWLTGLFREGRGVKAQWQHHMTGQHYDVAVIGSSRGWWNIDMNTVRARCGLRTVSLANNHYRDSEVLLSLKVFLANGNTADRVLMQVDHDNLSVEADHFSSTVYDFLPYLEDTVVYHHLSPRSPEWTAMRYIPFWRYTVCNFKWGVEQALVTATDRRPPLFDSTGTYFSNPRFYGPDSVGMWPSTYAASADLKAIIALCKVKDIQLAFFMSPYYRLLGAPEVLAGPATALQVEGFALHDYSMRLTEKRLFNDTKHINIEGGKVFTDLLIREVICPDTRPPALP